MCVRVSVCVAGVCVPYYQTSGKKEDGSACVCVHVPVSSVAVRVCVCVCVPCRHQTYVRSERGWKEACLCH